ncbi:NUDIX hydrolase domain-like protein [Entophlyctis helioformis]|nr:NUDIX hydrolase domain-like protein [Entophlyctis helioformis]
MADIQLLRSLSDVLQGRPPFKLANTAECSKRASVAAVLRLRPRQESQGFTAPVASVRDLLKAPWAQDAVLEVFYIRRAINPRDRWSGHVAFPGGSNEVGETDKEAAERETIEETGLDLRTPEFAYLGELDDREVKIPSNGRRLMALSCHVFVQLSPTQLATTLSEREVSSVFWIPFSLFTDPSRQTWKSIKFDISRHALPPLSPHAAAWKRSLRSIVETSMNLLIGGYGFPGIVLPGSRKDDIPLWGMTLWLTGDLAALAVGMSITGSDSLGAKAGPRYSAPDVHLFAMLLTLGRYPEGSLVHDNQPVVGLPMHRAVGMSILLSFAWKVAALYGAAQYLPSLIQWARASL